MRSCEYRLRPFGEGFALGQAFTSGAIDPRCHAFHIVGIGRRIASSMLPERDRDLAGFVGSAALSGSVRRSMPEICVRRR
jgi:hypothetical protein